MQITKQYKEKCNFYYYYYFYNGVRTNFINFGPAKLAKQIGK